MIALALEPTVALRTAIRARLTADPAVMALVQPENIRSGSTRPGTAPCVVLSAGQIEYLGFTGGSQHTARIFMSAHRWAIEDGAERAEAIGLAVVRAMRGFRDLHHDSIAIDDWEQPVTRWMRDPLPELTYTNGIIR